MADLLEPTVDLPSGDFGAADLSGTCLGGELVGGKHEPQHPAAIRLNYSLLS